MSASVNLVESMRVNGASTQSIWVNTNKYVDELASKDSQLFVVKLGESEKEYKKRFNSIITSLLDESEGESLPEEGYNRSGKHIKLRKKDGSFKWSAWSGSARFMQNLSDIGKAKYYGVSTSSTLSRGELLKNIKSVIDDATATVEEAIGLDGVAFLKDQLKGAKKIIEKMTPVQAKELDKDFQECYITLLNKVNEKE